MDARTKRSAQTPVTHPARLAQDQPQTTVSSACAMLIVPIQNSRAHVVSAISDLWAPQTTVAPSALMAVMCAAAAGNMIARCAEETTSWLMYHQEHANPAWMRSAITTMQSATENPTASLAPRALVARTNGMTWHKSSVGIALTTAVNARTQTKTACIVSNVLQAISWPLAATSASTSARLASKKYLETLFVSERMTLDLSPSHSSPSRTASAAHGSSQSRRYLIASRLTCGLSSSSVAQASSLSRRMILMPLTTGDCTSTENTITLPSRCSPFTTASL